MEIIDTNDLLDAAGIEVTSVSCVEVKHRIRREATALRRGPCVKAQDSIGRSPRTHRTTKNPS
jgi:hypothetical protein